MPQSLQEILPWWPVVLVCPAVAWAAWVVGRRLLPPQRQRAVPWTAFEILVAGFVAYVFWGAFFYQILVGTGLGAWIYGHNVVASVRGETADKIAQMRLLLLANAMAFPFQVLTLVGVPRLVSGTQPYQLGLTTARLGRNGLLGVLGWLILTPPVLALNGLATWLLSLLSREKGIAEHPFTRLSQNPALSGGEFTLIVLLAVVVAPVLEELIFRGLLQRWFARYRWGGDVALGLALLWAAGYSILQFAGAGEWAARLEALGPLLFVLAMAAVFAVVRRQRRTPFGPALFGTALLFATFHSSVWPSPVALFVLALGLGWLAQRTQSLAGPMVLHALFNAVACVQLLLDRFHTG